MAAGIYDSRNASHNWPASNGTNPKGIGGSGANYSTSSDPSLRQRYQPYAAPTSTAIPRQGSGSSLGMSAPAYDTRGHSLTSSPPHNDVEMTRDTLGAVLEYFSQLLPKYFDWGVVQGIAAATASAAKAPTIPPMAGPQMTVPQPMPQGMRLVVHGGACMLLHPGLYSLSKQQQQASPGLVSRTKTRDVDYIHRGFMAEYSPHIPDAAERLQDCIRATAARFQLGADWMNSDADIALPMAKDPSDGRLYDPVYNASVNPQNIALHTIYRSSNGFLTLISVTPSWAVSLKLVRYTKWDAGDICLLLRNGTLLSQTQWTPETLEGWLYTECWAMNYGNFDPVKRAQMRSRIEHAIQTLAQWTHYVSSGSSPPSRRSSSGELAGAALPGGQYLDAPHHAGQWGGSSQEASSLSRSRPQSKGKNRMSSDDLTEAALAGSQYLDAQHHASQWGASSQSQQATGLSRSRPQSKGKSKSSNGSGSRNASRPASRAASRRNSPEQPEIFIPPEIEPYDEEDAVDRYAQHYDHDRGRSATYASARAPAHERGAQQGAWGAAPAGRSRVHTIHDPVAPSHPLLANGSTGGGATGSPWGGQSQSQSRAADPYSMHVLDQAIGGGPPPVGIAPEYTRGPNFAGVGAGFPPVIPGVNVPDPAQVQQQQQRRRAEKQRKLERQRARGSKWRAAMSDTESDEDDAYTDDDDDKENRMRDHRQRRDPALAKGAQGGAWHQLYAPPMGRSTSGGSQGGVYAPERGPERGFAPFAQSQNPPGRTEGRAQGRSSSRPPSRNEPSDNKRRPPPLDLESPFIPPGQGPEFADPARIAQWQFEQQRNNYQLEREQQQILAEREHLYYQRRQFAQVPAAGQPPHPQMQMQMHYQQQQQHYPQQQQQQHPLYQHQQMYQQPMQMQMAQTQRGIYR